MLRYAKFMSELYTTTRRHMLSAPKINELGPCTQMVLKASPMSKDHPIAQHFETRCPGIGEQTEIAFKELQNRLTDDPEYAIAFEKRNAHLNQTIEEDLERQREEYEASYHKFGY